MKLLLILLASLMLVGCKKEEPPEVVEVKEIVLKAVSDTVLMCLDTSSSTYDASDAVVPEFLLRNDRNCYNGCNVAFVEVGSRWCYWDNQFNNGKSVTFSLESTNGQASGTEELSVWHIRQGTEIEKVLELTPHMLIGSDNGVYRATVVLQEPGSPIMLVSPDYVIQIPDVEQ